MFLRQRILHIFCYLIPFDRFAAVERFSTSDSDFQRSFDPPSCSPEDDSSSCYIFLSCNFYSRSHFLVLFSSHRSCFKLRFFLWISALFCFFVLASFFIYADIFLFFPSRKSYSRNRLLGIETDKINFGIYITIFLLLSLGTVCRTLSTRRAAITHQVLVVSSTMCEKTETGTYPHKLFLFRTYYLSLVSCFATKNWRAFSFVAFSRINNNFPRIFLLICGAWDFYNKIGGKLRFQFCDSNFFSGC